MIEIKALPDGRFEVYAAGHHHEIFDGSLGAIVVAEALAGQMAIEHSRSITIQAPWGDRQVRALPPS